MPPTKMFAKKFTYPRRNFGHPPRNFQFLAFVRFSSPFFCWRIFQLLRFSPLDSARFQRIHADAGGHDFTRRPAADRGRQWWVQIACPSLLQTRAGPRRGRLLADEAMPMADQGGLWWGNMGKKRDAHLALVSGL